MGITLSPSVISPLKKVEPVFAGEIELTIPLTVTLDSGMCIWLGDKGDRGLVSRNLLGEGPGLSNILREAIDTGKT